MNKTRCLAFFSNDEERQGKSGADIPLELISCGDEQRRCDAVVSYKFRSCLSQIRMGHVTAVRTSPSDRRISSSRPMKSSCHRVVFCLGATENVFTDEEIDRKERERESGLEKSSVKSVCGEADERVSSSLNSDDLAKEMMRKGIPRRWTWTWTLLFSRTRRRRMNVSESSVRLSGTSSLTHHQFLL